MLYSFQAFRRDYIFKETQAYPEPLKYWPSQILFNNGKNAEGWWGGDETVAQFENMMIQHEFFFPGRPALYEYDFSSGHLKKALTALVVGSMSVKYGGTSQSTKIRDTILTDQCVGDATAFLWKSPDGTKWSKGDVSGWTKVDCRLYAGDTQHTIWREDDPPPHWNLDAPKYDIAGTSIDGKPKNVEGYLGKAVGKSQMVWRRGLWIDGMTEKGPSVKGALPVPDVISPEDGLDAEFEDAVPQIPGRQMGDFSELMQAAMATKSLNKVLQTCEDFATEPSILQGLAEKNGYILIFSPKCHPELAGNGIEYAWGMSKKVFRKSNGEVGPKKLSAKNLHDRVLASFHAVKIENVLAFARRARRYRMAYTPGAHSEKLLSYLDIQRYVKKHKCHRSILDSAPKFLNTAIAAGPDLEDLETIFD